MEPIVNLKRFRKKLKISQTIVAESIGIDQRQWSRYEKGKNEFPVRYLKELCKKWNISADWLLELDNEREESDSN